MASFKSFLKDLMLAGLPQIIPQKVWSFRAWRKSFPEGFGVSAHGESLFLKVGWLCILQ